MVIPHNPILHYQETSFVMIYGANVMLPMEIDMPLWRGSHFDQEVKKG